MTLNKFFNSKQIELHPCGKEFLKKRKDDNLDIVIARYDTYMSATKPVLDFYAKKANFTEIDGAADIEQITKKITEAEKQNRFQIKEKVKKSRAASQKFEQVVQKVQRDKKND
jgi:hypothetical protein